MRWALSIVGILAGLLLYQNCGSSFSGLSEAEMAAMGCGTQHACDSLGNPLGKVRIEELSQGEYPIGSYSPARVETKTLLADSSNMISFLTIRLPDGYSCPAAWLAGSYATQPSVNTLDFVQAIQNSTCRIGAPTQADELTELLLKTPCFFLEETYAIRHDLSTGMLSAVRSDGLVLDDDFIRTKVSARRVRFHCQLPE